MVDGVLGGQYYYFPDAVNPAPVPPYPVPITEREILELRIMGATGHDRYTERLAGTDLSRVLYVYGIEDMIVGRLTDDESASRPPAEVGSSRSRAATCRCSRTRRSPARSPPRWPSEPPRHPVQTRLTWRSPVRLAVYSPVARFSSATSC